MPPAPREAVISYLPSSISPVFTSISLRRSATSDCDGADVSERASGRRRAASGTGEGGAGGRGGPGRGTNRRAVDRLAAIGEEGECSEQVSRRISVQAR